jgi:FkbM family methyltransferase
VNYATLVVNVVLNAQNDRTVTLPVLLDHTNRVLHLGMPDQSWLFSGAVVPGPRPDAVEVSHTVIVARLDTFRDQYALKRPNLIKVDVDGNEYHCLEGMNQTLKDAGLKSVMVEMRENSQERDKVESVLKSAGFAFESQHAAPHKEVFNYIWSRPEAPEAQVA